MRVTFCRGRNNPSCRRVGSCSAQSLEVTKDACGRHTVKSMLDGVLDPIVCFSGVFARSSSDPWLQASYNGGPLSELCLARTPRLLLVATDGAVHDVQYNSWRWSVRRVSKRKAKTWSCEKRIAGCAALEMKAFGRKGPPD